VERGETKDMMSRLSIEGIRVISDFMPWKKDLKKEPFPLKSAPAFNHPTDLTRVLGQIERVIAHVDKHGGFGLAYIYRRKLMVEDQQKKVEAALSIDTFNSGEIIYLENVHKVLKRFTNENGEFSDEEKNREAVVRCADRFAKAQ
jgi:hypothetical protein